MRAKWAGRLCFWGMLVLATGIGVPMMAIYLAGGGEMGIEFVATTGIASLAIIGVGVGVPLILLGSIAWTVLKVEHHKIQRLK
jgi:hypothetical protein